MVCVYTKKTTATRTLQHEHPNDQDLKIYRNRIHKIFGDSSTNSSKTSKSPTGGNMVSDRSTSVLYKLQGKEGNVYSVDDARKSLLKSFTKLHLLDNLFLTSGLEEYCPYEGIQGDMPSSPEASYADHGDSPHGSSSPTTTFSSKRPKHRRFIGNYYIGDALVVMRIRYI